MWRGSKRRLGVILCGVVLAGCSDKPTLFPNPDPNMRKTVGEWKADAAPRFPYKADAPHAYEARARAEVGYAVKRVELVNFSGEQWQDVEVWVNRQYVCHVPTMEDRKLKEIQFSLLYDAEGKRFPNNKIRVEKVELYRDGTMYDIQCHVGDD